MTMRLTDTVPVNIKSVKTLGINSHNSECSVQYLTQPRMTRLLTKMHDLYILSLFTNLTHWPLGDLIETLSKGFLI